MVHTLRLRRVSAILGVLVVLQLSVAAVAVRTTKLDAVDGADMADLEESEEPTQEPVVQQKLTPDDADVACEKIRYWRRQTMATNTPADVQKMVEDHGLLSEYTAMMATLLDAKSRFWLNKWDIPGIHRLLWAPPANIETIFRSKNVEILLRKKSGFFGSDIMLCFIDLTVHPHRTLDFAYSDAKNPMDEPLSDGAVAVIMMDPVFSVSGQKLKPQLENDESTDLRKFVSAFELSTETKDLKDAVKEIAVSSRSAEDVAMDFLGAQIAQESKFEAKGVKVYACYNQHTTFPRRNVFEHYWMEYVDTTKLPGYVPRYAILQEQQCEDLPSGKDVLPLGVRALMDQHNLDGKYKQMHRMLRLLLQNPSVYDPDPVYRTLWNQGFNDYFEARGIKLFVMSSEGSSPLQLCYQDTSKNSQNLEQRSDRYTDGVWVWSGPGERKDFLPSVMGEQLLESNQKIVFNVKQPVDVMRLLTRQGAADLHVDLANRVLTLPPSPYGEIAESVYDVVKQDFALKFHQKGVGVFVCSVMKEFDHGAYSSGFMYFHWMEYADLSTETGDPTYQPPERIQDTDEYNFTRSPLDHSGAPQSMATVTAAYLCIAGALLLRPLTGTVL